ncbi:hypothetical protein QM333_12910 [Pseudomonas aeruginosa]|uniref:hypothetical protein n=1 Tax=Pseudomonas aeruginosa TaxID=287 RepID=UPI0024B7E64E|nr:hypothetical protein [Pseudomonas aeruginosa]MDI9839015.1 hypothetical protein [Pseudomonas aeruginosa]
MTSLTPAQVIDNARQRIEAAQCREGLDVAWGQGLGALHTLLALGRIDLSTWRWHHADFDSRAELRAFALEQGGGQ